MNHAGHPGDEQQHRQAERIKPQTEIHLEAANAQPGYSGLANLGLPAHPGAEDQAQDKARNHRADGNGRAQLAVALREKGDQHRCTQREKQDNPG